MVALAVPRFGLIVEPNFARAYLRRAQLAEEAGDLIAAGCLLREAARRQLEAMCTWFDCWPKNPRRRRPMQLARALFEAKAFDQGGFNYMHEIIITGNAAAHCGRVDRGTLRGAIAICHYFIDADPCGEPKERFEHLISAVDAIDNGDDDEGGSLVKGGAV